MSDEKDNIRSIFGSTPREELKGAVDLAAPDQQAIRNFAQAIAEQGGADAIISIALTKRGQILTNAMAPGSTVQILGLLELAKVLLLQEQMKPQ
jgi:hypothetical protein